MSVLWPVAAAVRFDKVFLIFFIFTDDEILLDDTKAESN